jgi:SAM-dependent methyltransferase
MNTDPFGEYSQIYDSFYADKDYQNECKTIIEIAKSLYLDLRKGLEIGAGSGAFTKELLKFLAHIEVFELSPSMAKICANNLSQFENINVHQGDLSQILNSEINSADFDLVVANFHVFTYFTDTESKQFVEVSSNFLKPGGLVCFDFWDLEAVKARPPVPVIKIALHSGREIIRKTFPRAMENYREIEIDFEFYESSDFLFREIHKMYPRYLNEIIELFKGKFDFCGSYDINTGKSYKKEHYGNLVFFRKT